ncbi:DUF169 domain-containing protein [Methanolobus sp. ZRKC3]|uniref:DUF169 domain-containing protein n=1 Tax=Methanolobus sp. ZRKC3 TaxID=3125786 RepID=UPI003252D388
MDIEQINKLGLELRELLKLETLPVAVGLVTDEKDIPAGIKKLDHVTRHCQMVDDVRRSGDEFYSTIEEQQCRGGAAVMGMTEMADQLKSGEFYYSLNSFSSVESAKETMDKIPEIKEKNVTAIMYAPLEKASFVPDVIIFIAKPKKAMELSQTLLFEKGGRIEANFAGKQSLCGDGVALPYLSNKPSVTVGCGGSRNYTEIKEEEMVISIPVEKLEELVCSAKKMFRK